MNNRYSMNIEYTNHVVIDANYGDSGKGRAVDNISKYCLDLSYQHFLFRRILCQADTDYQISH